MTLEPCAVNILFFTVLSYDVIVDIKWALSSRVGSSTATWWRWVGPVVYIQVTEWVNIMNKISDENGDVGQA